MPRRPQMWTIRVHSIGDNLLYFLLGGVSRPIRSPRELYVDEQPLGILSFEIIDAEGMRQIVTLRDPLLLPAPLIPGR